MTPQEWAQEQLKPLSMFETAKWWADGLKVVGAGNGAGFLTAGAALTSFHEHPRALLEVKFAGVAFFIGILAFALGFLQVHVAMHAQDEVAQGTMHKDIERIKTNTLVSGSSMMLANRCAILSAITFFVGCIIGLIAFVSF
jgi:hypothetical protein